MMEETSAPLQFDEIDVKKKNEGKFVSKFVIIAVLAAILLLVILVIVLGALLGSERAKQRTKSAGDESSTDKEVQTTATPGPTTPGTEVWWNVRLPRSIVPKNYDLTLKIDLKNYRFGGKVDIIVEVVEPTSYVLVHTNKLNVTDVRVEDDDGDSMSIKNHFWFEKNQFYVMEMTSSLELGIYHIKMEYDSTLYDEPRTGLYRVEYKRKDEKKVTIAATQFEATDARKAFPCFDEPALKATFKVKLIHDKDMIALSNTPIENSYIKDDWQHDNFKETVKMSTYLLAFVICDYKFKEITTNNNVQLRIYAPPDQIDQVDYARVIGKKLLDYYDRFFGIKYPLPKVDLIAIPNFPFGAMENWGLITFRPAYLLFKDAESSEINKAQVAEVISHELSHQWFGNLVTMKWWNDLWLNEGFATFMTYPGIDHVHPDWKMDENFIVGKMASAFSLDGLTSSHPVSVPIERPEEIEDIFDSISYEKQSRHQLKQDNSKGWLRAFHYYAIGLVNSFLGVVNTFLLLRRRAKARNGGSILRMLEAYLGRNMLKKGLNHYLKKFEFGNADTPDLWVALGEETCTQGKCVDVRAMMDTWTLQMGYPVLKIKKAGETYEVTQERFLYDRNAEESQKYKSPFNYLWFVPFTYFTGSESSTPTHPISKIINKTPSEKIDWDGTGWIKGNAGFKGFYRVNYEDSNWDALAEQMNFNHLTFNISDRANLIDDAFNLARGGYLKYDKAFNMTSYIKGETDYVPWKTATTNWAYLQGILSPATPVYKLLEEYIRYQMETQYGKLGFKDEGNHLERYLRTIVLHETCKAVEKTCLVNVALYFDNWMKSPENNSVPANFRDLVYYYGIAFGGEREWDFMFEQYQKTTVASEKNKFIIGLSAVREPWILSRYLRYSLNTSKIISQDTGKVIAAVSLYNSAGQQMAWDFIQMNWATLLERYGKELYVLKRLLGQVANGFASEYRLQELTEFYQKHGDAGVGSISWNQILERVRANVAWRKANEKDIEQWLRDFFANKPGSLKKDVDSGFTDPF